MEFILTFPLVQEPPGRGTFWNSLRSRSVRKWELLGWRTVGSRKIHGSRFPWISGFLQEQSSELWEQTRSNGSRFPWISGFLQEQSSELWDQGKSNGSCFPWGVLQEHSEMWDQTRSNGSRFPLDLGIPSGAELIAVGSGKIQWIPFSLDLGIPSGAELRTVGSRKIQWIPVFPGSGDSFRSRAQSCGIKEDPMDPVFPGSGDSFRSRAQRSGIKEEPLDLDPVFPGSQDSFRSRAQSCGIRQDPMDPVFPGSGDSFRSRAQSCGIRENPMDPVFPGSQDSFRSRAQSCGIRENPMDPIFPGESFRAELRTVESRKIQWIPFSLDLRIPSGAELSALGSRKSPWIWIPFSPGSQDSFRSRAQRSEIRQDPMDPVFPGSGDSLRNPSSNPSPFPRSLPAPRAHSRKRPLPSAASGTPNLQRDPWEEPEQKIPRPERDQAGDGGAGSGTSPGLPLRPPGHSELGRSPGISGRSPRRNPPNIFAFLPVLDLYQSLSLVCRCWREIIQDPLFIPWKKLYHRYLKREERALQRVEQILQEFSITKERRECVLGLVRLVSRTPTDPRVDPDAVLQALGSHPLFPKARFCVLEKFPDLMSKPGPEKMWATLAVMVLFSDGVGDIWLLLERLRSPRSQLGALEVTEALHCMATLLFAMRDRRIPISNRIHYNIFYCLYLMENASGIVQPLEEGRVDSR
ncbi:hypothetical protein DUI87_33300 [Hirundo rustica rustica]|uniref:F-box DNA helicase 1 n=1 Tax=Hirundo rustica rustica TaxID=333673 RepID=A0A3M0IMT4_HIRRU|nr:hypothetical protein DUI87_33300 [Hirundo rustica rustica]